MVNKLITIFLKHKHIYRGCISGFILSNFMLVGVVTKSQESIQRKY